MRGKLKSRSPIPPGGEMSGTRRRPQHGALLPALLLLLLPGLCHGQLGVQAPVLVQEPPARLRFSNSTGAQLSCSARGSPPPDVAWLHPNGSPVTAVPGLRQPLGNGTLYFPPFRAEDYREQVHSATYRCRASNLGGAVLSRDVMVRAGEYRTGFPLSPPTAAARLETETYQQIS
ncbi:Down syndrome cell adhesion molecule-like protein Dscam2 [Schistocerca gregaria]|uniref:Down syndrome cell adhesion molecule-like protein Dscam2 n=1 Tax=Schistocerca gregaria TaxID=7010 RepID=UPI00211EE54B|nr:Down syndrome cell adhesion molecule-like protein Dscam2 [Schistocerca gregaria]